MDISNDSDSDSDKELQAAFQTGLLEPGLFVSAKVPERKRINDKAGLTKTLEELKASKKDLPWVERLDLTVDPAPASRVAEEHLLAQAGDDDVHDDFKREMRFYRIAQAGILKAIPRLHALGLTTKRPDDYFAEMAKSDSHMKRIREKLKSKQVSMERSAKAKKMRELRKYGKKVQQEVLLKRQKEKKDMMQQVKKFRKGQSDTIDFLDDKPSKGNKKNAQDSSKVFQPNKKRDYKNKKYGFGGQKKRSKHNTAKSSASMAGYSAKKHGSVPSKYQNKNKPSSKRKGVGNKRPGKLRRQKTKNT